MEDGNIIVLHCECIKMIHFYCSIFIRIAITVIIIAESIFPLIFMRDERLKRKMHKFQKRSA